MLVGVVKTHQVIPLAESFTNDLWPRNGCPAAGGPVRLIIYILKVGGKIQSATRNAELRTAVSEAPME